MNISSNTIIQEVAVSNKKESTYKTILLKQFRSLLSGSGTFYQNCFIFVFVLTDIFLSFS